MLKAIITFLNLKLELLNYFDMTHCLSELKDVSGEDGVTAPKEYISDGNWANINFDAFDGVSYWRLRDEITTSPLDNEYKAGKRIQTTVPLKLVFSVRREKLTTDDAYSYDRIRQTIVKQFNIDDGALKISLGAEKILITSPTANGDPKEVWEGETANTGTFEPKYEVVFGSVDIDVVITSKGSCLPTECDDVDSNILHTFDFCNAAVRDGLTQIQIDCLIAAYCGACDPATLTVNGDAFTTVASGGSLDIAVHDTADADVGTVVSTTEIEIADTTVQNNATPTWSDTVEAEGTLTLGQSKALDSDGVTTLLADYIPTADGFMFTCSLAATCQSLEVTVTDTTPSFGDTITITATPTGIAPDEYRFYIPQFDGSYQAVVQAGNTYSWTVGATGTLSIGVIACEGTDHVGNIATATVAAAFFDDLTSVSPVYLLSLNRYLKGSFVGSDVALIRRVSDSALQAFTPDEITDGTLTTWTGANDGALVTEYDHSGNGNDRTQPNTARQGLLVVAGVLQTDSNGNPKVNLPTLREGMFSVANYGLTSSTGSYYTVSQAVLGFSFGTKGSFLRGVNSDNMNVTPYGVRVTDNAPTSNVTNSNMGTPEYMVNSVDFGTSAQNNQFIAQESISFFTQLNFTLSTWNTIFTENCAFETGSEVSGESALFDGDISADLTNLTNNSNTFYGYY